MSDMEINKVLAQMRTLAQGIEKPADSSEVSGPAFNKVLGEAINKVNEIQQEATSMTADWERGKSNLDLSEVMITAQKSSLSFQAMMEVRNKLVEAYREIMNMSV
ncbi:MAG: flagellar hook-basal body complex protein FliE [Gammaproteobacteria bacterium]|nr:flagellar hook-basal body complex protein FliE [Gammaproteobacteria bacterium]